MNDNITLRRLTGAAVLLVAAIGATVSYLHIERLALHLGQPPLAAWLMPLSVDGTVGDASAALLWSARTGQRSPWTARTMLALGVLATLAANADFGSSHSAAGVIMSAWPGIAFVGSAEVALGMVRKLPNPRPRGYARRSPAGSPLGSRPGLFACAVSPCGELRSLPPRCLVGGVHLAGHPSLVLVGALGRLGVAGPPGADLREARPLRHAALRVLPGGTLRRCDRPGALEDVRAVLPSRPGLAERREVGAASR